MAKGKIFSDGQPLTAADVNTYLNPDVISAGLPYNSGWQTTTAFTLPESATPYATAPLKVRRLGLKVEIAGAVSYPAGFFPTTTPLLILNTGYRPLAPLKPVIHLNNTVATVTLLANGAITSIGSLSGGYSTVWFNISYGIG